MATIWPESATRGPNTVFSLVALGSLRETDGAALAVQFGTDVIDLGRETPQPEAVDRLPEATARAG